VERTAGELVRRRNAFRADQFRLPGNAAAHRLHTGAEILRQTGGKLDAFCDFVGTGGSFAGCAEAFKAHNPAIRCFAVEPASAAILAGRPVLDPNHRIQGGGYSMDASTLRAQWRPELADGFLQVTDEEAFAACRRLAREEGIFAGISSGANAAAALKWLALPDMAGKTVAILLCDSGLKYLSTELWNQTT
jgi:cysteine synthase A